MRTSLAACLVAAFALAGCASDKSTSATPSAATVNQTCPVGGGKVVAASHREWKGTSIGFCCDGCAGKFDRMSDAEKDSVATLAKANKVK